MFQAKRCQAKFIPRTPKPTNSDVALSWSDVAFDAATSLAETDNPTQPTTGTICDNLGKQTPRALKTPR